MLICSALYYAGTLAQPQSLVRDNRFYPGKCVESWPLWWAYLRKHYPDARVVLFADSGSRCPVQPLVEATIKEPYVWYGLPQGNAPEIVSVDNWTGERVHIQTVVQHSTKRYFWAMQRNLVAGIITAYRANEDLFWLDNDAFLNTDIRPLVRGADVAAPQIAHHQQTMDSVCTFISARRLHALDDLGIDLPSFLTTMLNEGPTETRMHTLQEGGLYKLFCYGDARAIGAQVELSHLSCYDRFMTFLRRNPLDTPEYRSLVAQLETVDWNALPGVERSFHDMLYPENAFLAP
jgi:hypothetical protein